MKEIILQKKPKCPNCSREIDIFMAEDKPKLDNFKLNEPIKAKLYGRQKERSLKQLALYYVRCQFLSDSIDHTRYDTKEKVDFELRVTARFYDPEKVSVRKGQVFFELRSIAYKNLKHIEACNYFPVAYENMIDILNRYYKSKGLTERMTPEKFDKMVEEWKRENNKR